MMFDKRTNVIANVATMGSIAIFLAGCTNYDDVFEDNFGYGQSTKGVEFSGSTLKDLRDNHTYEVAKVGSLYWMMQDLSYEYYSTGKDYYLITACPKQYTNDVADCDETGFLYPGQRLEHACPAGWRLPDVDEWQNFYNSSTFKNSSRSSYKGYIGGDKSQNKYGEAAYYWANTIFSTSGYKDCVSFTSDDNSFEAAGLCHEQWKMSVRCVLDADNVDDGPVTKSSSSGTETSSSSVDPSKACGDLWCGATDTQGQVETGSFDEDAGCWYACSDAGLIKDFQGVASYCNTVGDNGNSTINFPEDVEENQYGNFFGPLIETYGGIVGEVVLGPAYIYPYAYLAFNLVDKERTGMDISDWGGICLVYESSIAFSVELAVENDSVVTEYDNYRANLSTTGKYLPTTPVLVDIPWDKFEQEGWGKQVNPEKILAKVAAISLHFKGGSGESGEFNIRSIGRLGTCK